MVCSSNGRVRPRKAVRQIDSVVEIVHVSFDNSTSLDQNNQNMLSNRIRSLIDRNGRILSCEVALNLTKQ
jgi:hypothetical protein